MSEGPSWLCPPLPVSLHVDPAGVSAWEEEHLLQLPAGPSEVIIPRSIFTWEAGPWAYPIIINRVLAPTQGKSACG